MKINEIISEDTLTSSIATVSMPLFGDPAMIRRAVDPYGYTINKKGKKPNKYTKPYNKKIKSVYPKEK